VNLSSSTKYRSIKAIILLVGLATVLMSALSPTPVFAHSDGTMQLASGPAGPYKITVWTWPDPARTGEVHISIAVVLAEDASPVLDASVRVDMKSSSGNETLSAPATTEDSENKFLYEVVMDVPKSGSYEITIAATGNDNSGGEVTFQLEVVSGKTVNWLLLIPTAVVLVGIIYWLIRKRRRMVQ
jgi:hypothetical protein